MTLFDYMHAHPYMAIWLTFVAIYIATALGARK